jgi:hypothetical protein
MINTAAGYVASTSENVAVTDKGRAPKFWWDTSVPDGDATPWASAPVGSIYIQKASESVTPVLYFKVDAAGNDNDWASLSVGRTISGGPVGLLLALTKN